ncbi:MAG: hypothetical protein LBJ89_00650 [Holosporales bacterium]|jgi:hypothetical protein|nr:hypothetical protein [Holosporales bacterium]
MVGMLNQATRQISNKINACAVGTIKPDAQTRVFVISKKGPDLILDPTTTLNAIDSKITSFPQDLIFVVFDEMFFGSVRPLTQFERDNIMRQIDAFSQKHKNVIICPHFLYIADEGPTFQNAGNWEHFRSAYIDCLDPDVGGFGKFDDTKPVKEAPVYEKLQELNQNRQYSPKNIIKLSLSYHPVCISTFDMNSLKKESIDNVRLLKWDTIQEQVSTPMSASRSEVAFWGTYKALLNNTTFEKHFRFLRSESYIVWSGRHLISYKKTSYWKEANNYLVNRLYGDDVLIYDIGSGENSVTDNSAEIRQLAHDLNSFLSIELCFDLNRGISEHFVRVTPPMIHIIQSKTIDPKRNLQKLPLNRIIIQADNMYKMLFSVAH